jgi:hypothetical protein
LRARLLALAAASAAKDEQTGSSVRTGRPGATPTSSQTPPNHQRTDRGGVGDRGLWTNLPSGVSARRRTVAYRPLLYGQGAPSPVSVDPLKRMIASPVPPVASTYSQVGVLTATVAGLIRSL